MPTGRTDTDSAASLYGPVALALGIAATAAAAASEFVGIAIPLLIGLLAVTFGALGLAQKTNRGKSLVGLVGGCVGVATAIGIISAFSG